LRRPSCSIKAKTAGRFLIRGKRFILEAVESAIRFLRIDSPPAVALIAVLIGGYDLYRVRKSPFKNRRARFESRLIRMCLVLSRIDWISGSHVLRANNMLGMFAAAN
jgi:hypothetical protein